MNAFDKTSDALADVASEGAKTGRRLGRQVASAGDSAGSDIRALLKDLEASLKEGKDDDVGALRARLEARLADARATYDDAQFSIRQKIQAAAETTDGFVRDRPWETIGAAAGIAFLLGIIIGRG